MSGESSVSLNMPRLVPQRQGECESQGKSRVPNSAISTLGPERTRGRNSRLGALASEPTSHTQEEWELKER